MQSFQELLDQGAANAWLFIPTAIVLGALHGLEPGHSKTMMGGVHHRGARHRRAGRVARTLRRDSHSLIIWALAAAALRFGSRWNAEATEPIFNSHRASSSSGWRAGRSGAPGETRRRKPRTIITIMDRTE